jgi:amidohydrolase
VQEDGSQSRRATAGIRLRGAPEDRFHGRARHPKKRRRPTVLMRADMDALPGAEDTGLPYASKVTADDVGEEVPVAHACGHDVHVACLLGAARLVAECNSAWSGTFIALFQPAEELADGARRMIDGGLAGMIPKPDVALAQHVLAFPSGHLGTRPGAFLSSADSMRITVFGRGSHGSMPQLSVDPVLLAASTALRLQTVVSREVTPGEFAVLTIGRLSAGTKSNIISDRAVLELNIRTFGTTPANSFWTRSDGSSAENAAPPAPRRIPT